jgi:hypothetical protein
MSGVIIVVVRAGLHSIRFARFSYFASLHVACVEDSSPHAMGPRAVIGGLFEFLLVF